MATPSRRASTATVQSWSGGRGTTTSLPPAEVHSACHGITLDDIWSASTSTPRRCALIRWRKLCAASDIAYEQLGVRQMSSALAPTSEAKRARTVSRSADVSPMSHGECALRCAAASPAASDGSGSGLRPAALR